MSEKKTVVISAFPASGKSYTLKKCTKYSILDSDPSNYNWIKDEEGKNTSERNPDFPNNFIEHIKENIGKVDFIFVSSHKVVRDALKENDIKYVLIYPDVSLRQEFLNRMAHRGNDSKFIEIMEKNFETFVKECNEEEYPYIYKLGIDNDLYINEDLLTYFKYLKLENLNIIKASKLVDDIDTQILDTDKTILVRIPSRARTIQEQKNLMYLTNSIKNIFGKGKVLIVPKDINFEMMTEKLAIDFREQLDRIINKESKED